MRTLTGLSLGTVLLLVGCSDGVVPSDEEIQTEDDTGAGPAPEDGDDTGGGAVPAATGAYLDR